MKSTPNTYESANGKLDTDVDMNTGKRVEIDEISNAVNNVGVNSQVNMALINVFADPKLTGATFGSNARISYVAVNNGPANNYQQNVLELACAHEVGHQFLLSTENKGPVGDHDAGPFPTDLQHTVWHGLMYFESHVFQSEWLRWEDWLKANDTAGRK